MDRRRPDPPQNLWAYHDKVKSWILLIENLRGQAAVDELIKRQDGVRRSGQPCKFKLLPVGREPEGKP